MRENLLLELVNTLNPDVVFLQEIKCQNNEFPIIYKEKNYNLVIKGEKGKYGVAILIKKKIEFEEINFESAIFQSEARICGIKIKNNFNLHLINIYAPNGNPIESKEKFSYKIKWYSELHKFIKKLINSKVNIILAGDFNVIPAAEDVYNVKSFEDDALYRLEIRKKFREMLNLGFSDVYRHFNEVKEGFTFWDYMRGAWQKNNGMRIDHFLVSNSLIDQIKSININKDPRGKEKPSDHTPIEIKLT